MSCFNQANTKALDSHEICFMGCIWIESLRMEASSSDAPSRDFGDNAAQIDADTASPQTVTDDQPTILFSYFAQITFKYIEQSQKHDFPSSRVRLPASLAPAQSSSRRAPHHHRTEEPPCDRDRRGTPPPRAATEEGQEGR